MTTEETINKHERILHAMKGKLHALRNQRWIDENYKGEKSPLDTQIEQTKAEITIHRQALRELYQVALTPITEAEKLNILQGNE